jgi:hypothetical protein
LDQRRMEIPPLEKVHASSVAVVRVLFRHTFTVVG